MSRLRPFALIALCAASLSLSACRSTPKPAPDPDDVAYPIIGGFDPVTDKEIIDVR